MQEKFHLSINTKFVELYTWTHTMVMYRGLPVGKLQIVRVLYCSYYSLVNIQFIYNFLKTFFLFSRVYI